MTTLEYGSNTYKGLIINIERDDIDMNPRTEWDNLATMYCEHSNYTLGDKDAEDIRELDEYGDLVEGDVFKHFKGIILPLYLYDHSGITMRTSAFSCPFDSGQVGYIYISDEKIRKEYSVKRISKQLRERVTKYLVGEVETYDMYLTGEVYYFSIEDDGEEVDSCGGFFGMDSISEEVISNADAYLDEKKENDRKEYLNTLHGHFMKVKQMIRNHVPLTYREPLEL